MGVYHSLEKMKSYKPSYANLAKAGYLIFPLIQGALQESKKYKRVKTRSINDALLQALHTFLALRTIAVL